MCMLPIRHVRCKRLLKLSRIRAKGVGLRRKLVAALGGSPERLIRYAWSLVPAVPALADVPK